MLKTITRRSLLTTSALAVAAAGSLIPGAIGALRPKIQRPPEAVNIFNIAKTPLGIRPKLLIHAMQHYVDDYLFPVWGVRAQLQWSDQAQPGLMNMALVDDDENDDPDTIAYHDFDPTKNDAIPYALIDVNAALDTEDFGGLGAAVSHELGEMLVNPSCNTWAGPSAFDPDVAADSRLYALEIADPVCRSYFKVEGVPCSNFVFPAYFQPWRDSSPIDYLGALSQPGQLDVDGYQIVRDHEKISENANDSDDSVGELKRRCYRVRYLQRRYGVQKVR